MDFFKPSGNNGDGKNNKITGANIHKSTEDRLKSMKEKRLDRREKINKHVSNSNDNDNSYFKETEKLRKNKELSRSDYQKQERKDISRLGLRKNKNDEN